MWYVLGQVALEFDPSVHIALSPFFRCREHQLEQTVIVTSQETSSKAAPYSLQAAGFLKNFCLVLVSVQDGNGRFGDVAGLEDGLRLLGIK